MGKRLRNAREAMGLSVRKFAAKFGEDPSVIFHIETGKRWPPKQRIKKFAEVLSLKPEQLDALIAVERRGLDACQMLPEISPTAVKQIFIEREAQNAVSDFFKTKPASLAEGPVPIAELVEMSFGLSTIEADFEREKITGPHDEPLYGCLYPDGFQGHDKLVLVNTGDINGHRLSPAEKRVTVAHEAGHYFLHYGLRRTSQLMFRFTKEPTYCRAAEMYPKEFNLREHQANLFGACLLMPEPQFCKEWQRFEKDIDRVALRFNVTEACVVLRSRMLNCE